MTKQLSLEQLMTCGLAKPAAVAMLSQINQCLLYTKTTDCWQCLSKTILKPQHPFSLHELLYKTVFSDEDQGQDPATAWIPDRQQISSTNIFALMKELQIASYPELHNWSVQNRSQFWELMIRRLGISFREPYRQIMDLTQGAEFPRWLVGARMNIVESCFQSPENDVAIIFQRVGKACSTLTYGELEILTNRVANGLKDLGFTSGDRIAIAMPMTAESVAIYLGIIKAGSVVVAIADSLAAEEIATRLQLSQATGIFTQDYLLRGDKQLPLYAKVTEAKAPRAIVLSNNGHLAVELRQGDLSWEDFLSDREQFAAIGADPEAYTNILFSSGTTGEPKAIPWTQTTPLKCACDAHLHHDIHPQDVLAWPTNLGWMMGPWLIYASLINQATIALYYGTPTEREFGQFVQDAGVNMLGVVPSLVSRWKATGCMAGLDWSAIKAFSSTGECSHPQDMLFLMSLAGYKPIIEYCGGTEIGGGYITGTLVQPCAPATFTTPALGLDIKILDENYCPTSKGEVFIIPPSIGLSTELLNKNHHQVYFPDLPNLQRWETPLRRHGDEIERLANGYYRAHGRIDDTMNLGGIKVSSTEIEQVLNTVEGISETAAIAVASDRGGPCHLVIYAVMTSDSASLTSKAQIDRETLMIACQSAIKQHLNPLFKISDLVIIEALPRTASNKVMRRVLRDRYQSILTPTWQN